MKDFITMLLSVLVPVALILYDRWLTRRQVDEKDKRIKELETENSELGATAKKQERASRLSLSAVRAILSKSQKDALDRKWSSAMETELNSTKSEEEKQYSEHEPAQDISLESALEFSKKQVEYETESMD